MKMLKLLLCGLMLAMPAWANETDDRQTATSLKYVTHELDTRQNKLETGTNQAIEYTDSAGDVEQRTVKTDLASGSTTDTSLPTISAVTTGLNTKQNVINPIDDHTAVTYTGQTGGIGTKGIYQSSGTYAEQSDNLIDAKTFNAALKAGLDNEFVCANESQGAGAYAPSGDCWLWSIHNTYNVAVQPYISATGTVTQDGTPTPTNPIDPVFYRQGNMILRRVGDYADSYDATTHKITRRVGMRVFNGTERFNTSTAYGTALLLLSVAGTWGAEKNSTPVCSHFIGMPMNDSFKPENTCFFNSSGHFYFRTQDTPETFRSWLAQQYAAGTPVTVWYPLAEPVEEDWSATTYNENVYIPQNQ